jgi:hypothetical protein
MSHEIAEIGEMGSVIVTVIGVAIGAHPFLASAVLILQGAVHIFRLYRDWKREKELNSQQQNQNKDHEKP